MGEIKHLKRSLSNYQGMLTLKNSRSSYRPMEVICKITTVATSSSWRTRTHTSPGRRSVGKWWWSYFIHQSRRIYSSSSKGSSECQRDSETKSILKETMQSMNLAHLSREATISSKQRISGWTSKKTIMVPNLKWGIQIRSSGPTHSCLTSSSSQWLNPCRDRIIHSH